MKLVTSIVVLLGAMLAAPSFAQYQGYGGYSGYRGYGSPSGSSSRSYSAPRPTTPSYGTGSNWNSGSVRGYVRRDGTYVAPHRRSMPDSSVNNNWSTKGNANPYTGAQGKQRGNPYGW